MSRISKLLENNVPPATIWFGGVELHYEKTVDDIDDAQSLIDSFKAEGKASAATHNGNKHYIYASKKELKEDSSDFFFRVKLAKLGYTIYQINNILSEYDGEELFSVTKADLDKAAGPKTFEEEK